MVSIDKSGRMAERVSPNSLAIASLVIGSLALTSFIICSCLSESLMTIRHLSFSTLMIISYFIVK